jgi:hypothetical protein
VHCTASDRRGNSASGSFTITVRYRVCALYDQSAAKKSGSTIPIKLRLCDANGRSLSSRSIVLQAQSVVRISTNAAAPLADAGNANPDFTFRYDAALDGYTFNLGTRGYAKGPYELNFTVGEDPTPYSTRFAVN